MDKEKLRELKKHFETFLDSDQAVLKIEYEGTDINTSKYYHKILFGNPIRFLFRAGIISFCSILPSSEFKNSLYRLLGMKIGKGVSIPFGVRFDLLSPELVTIKDGAIIGADTMFFTHEVTISRIRIGRINIGKKALIGIRSTIRSGVNIGDYAMVGTCSFVNKDVKNHEIVGGVPAKRIKKITIPRTKQAVSQFK